MFFPTSFGTSLGKFWDKFWNAHWESWQLGSPGTGVGGACGKLRGRRQAAEEATWPGPRQPGGPARAPASQEASQGVRRRVLARPGASLGAGTGPGVIRARGQPRTKSNETSKKQARKVLGTGTPRRLFGKRKSARRPAGYALLALPLDTEDAVVELAAVKTPSCLASAPRFRCVWTDPYSGACKINAHCVPRAHRPPFGQQELWFRQGKFCAAPPHPPGVQC